jgi:threonine aldolase
LADAVRGSGGLQLQPDEVDTNIVIFRVDPQLGSAAEFVQRMADRGVAALAISPTQIRLVTHLDVSTADCRRAAEAIQRIAEESVGPRISLTHSVASA